MSVLKLSNQQNVEDYLSITKPTLNKKKKLNVPPSPVRVLPMVPINRAKLRGSDFR